MTTAADAWRKRHPEYANYPAPCPDPNCSCYKEDQTTLDMMRKDMLWPDGVSIHYDAWTRMFVFKWTDGEEAYISERFLKFAKGADHWSERPEVSENYVGYSFTAYHQRTDKEDAEK